MSTAYRIPDGLKVHGRGGYRAFRDLACPSGVKGKVTFFLPATPTTIEQWTGEWAYRRPVLDGVLAVQDWIFFGSPLPGLIDHRRAPDGLDPRHWSQASAPPYVVLQFGGNPESAHRYDLGSVLARPPHDGSIVFDEGWRDFSKVVDEGDPHARRVGQSDEFQRPLGDDELIPTLLAAETGLVTLLTDVTCLED